MNQLGNDGQEKNSAMVETDSTSGELQRRRSSATLPVGVYNIDPIARKIREFVSGRQKRRLVLKTGECNVASCNVMKRKQKYLVDIFTTLVDMKWRYHLILFAAAFVVSWCAFGLIWFIIAIVHQDHVNVNNDTWQGCVDHVYDYPTALLFSIETQTTIGYGFRVIQSECGFAIFVMMMQSCVGLFIQSLITGIIFAKISRPKGRSQTIMFSHKAVICKRDGQYNLLFRVGDMRKSHIIGTSIRALLVKNRLTSEGESIPLCQYPLTIETETSQTDSFVFLIWPVTVVHKINESSPLWDFSLEKLMSEHFEIIVLLEGTIESTGMSTQVRTSYIPMEIMWGERLVPLLTFQLQNGRYEIDYGQFHNTTPMSMPDCSAREYAERRENGTLEEMEKPDSEYLANFTAPAIRPHSNNSRSLHNLFSHRKFESSISVNEGKESSNGNNINSSRKFHPHHHHNHHHMDDIKKKCAVNDHRAAQVNPGFCQDGDQLKMCAPETNPSSRIQGACLPKKPTSQSDGPVDTPATDDSLKPQPGVTSGHQAMSLENLISQNPRFFTNELNMQNGNIDARSYL